MTKFHAPCLLLALLAVVLSMAGLLAVNSAIAAPVTADSFASPPDAARPWVYWFIMDGNLTREGITADFESMRDQGIGGFVMMEVNVGVPRGNVDFMSEEWQKLFVHIVREAERCGLQMTLPSGPGWAGSGGPWITPKDSMWHLVATELKVSGPAKLNEVLPTPVPRSPFFGEGALPSDQEKARKDFFRDVCVMAFPTPTGNARVVDIDEKAAYVRAPYSSTPGVRPLLPAPADFAKIPASETVDPSHIIDLTDRMDAGGRITWEVPAGNWTILRFAATSTGANTRPAPAPGMGLESSKMDRAAFDIHAEHYINKLLEAVGERRTDGKAGWCYFHIDSWEMGPQNYSPEFFKEFTKRRGYAPTPFLPAYTGRVVESLEQTERFLWDVRQTAQELILENHAEHLRNVAHRNGLQLSLEFYDMMPCCDMTFGAVADVPMCEFWDNTFDTVFSCFEAASIANTHGKSIVAAEAFTSGSDGWQVNPKSMKQRTDWALCTGINRFTFHRFQHQPLLDRYPGFSMGNIGSHWERTQTWWQLASGYHKYLARCQYLLRQGKAVVDVLYLLPEGAPQVFTPPQSALMIDGTIRDQRGYRFDGCDPDTFLKLASVEDGEIVFPNATRYRLLVLPAMETMTLPLLKKIEQLVSDGAVVVGPLPRKSPSLQEYPQVDTQIHDLATKLRGTTYLSLASGDKGEVPLGFDGAKWIWFPEGSPAWDAPAGPRYFRQTFSVDEGVTVRSARLLAVADNDVIVKVNGREVYRANLRDAVREINFARELKQGQNWLEITAINGENDARNPTGLVAQIEVVTEDASGKCSTQRLSTDTAWEVSLEAVSNGSWKKAIELGDFGMGPWGHIASPTAAASSLYPEYSETAAILSQRGIPTDFASQDDSLRFYHRRDGDVDYYFVGNRKTTPYNGEVSFRVTGKKASVVDPLTGRIFRSPKVTETDGLTRIHFSLDGSESVFVVFGGLEADANAPLWGHRELTPVMTLNDEWLVRFDPRMGGPVDEVRFDQLADWTASEQPGIRYYSGMATYERKFHYSTNKNGGRLFIDLGNVEVMAEVRINSKLCGTRWVAPYRLEITDLVRDGENDISIRVANLWPNRLIGDAKLPASQRVTWSTWHNGGYSADSPLLPSGLLGPVTLVTEEFIESER